MDDQIDLVKTAKAVLEMNDQGSYIIPRHNLYPHQWLWDSAFIAIGLRNLDIDRAQTEILSIFRGQWSNGMLPHIIFSEHEKHYHDREIWSSWVNPNSPDNIATSGITQPPIIAEAIVKIGTKLSTTERRIWYKTIYPGLLAYHQWLYKERDPHNEGLVLLIHPWESGLDNTPPWMVEMHHNSMPLTVKIFKTLHLSKFVNLFRRDTHFMPARERLSAEEGLSFYLAMRQLRRKAYDIKKILPHSLFSIEDLTFNSILIRANNHLKSIAKLINKDIPEELLDSMKKTEAALDQLWDPYTLQYYSRNFITHELINVPSIAGLMPLYAGTINKAKADKLVESLENKRLYGPAYPIPSVPTNSPWFHSTGYWQGSTWLNTNWMIMDGLRRMGYHEHYEVLKELTLEMLSKSGMSEYFNPLTGDAAGSENFSWTAALAIDLSLNK